MVQALKDENWIAAVAVGGLDRAGWKPANDAERIAYMIARQDWMGLRNCGEPCIAPLMEALKTGKGFGKKETVLTALGVIAHPSSVEGLVGSLADPSPAARALAVQALGNIGDRRAVPALCAMLGPDQLPDVREKSATALGKMKDPGATDALIKLMSDPASKLQAAAAMALGSIKDPRAAPALLAGLRSPYREASDACAKALREMKDPGVVETMLPALKDENVRVRRVAAQVLSGISDPRVTAPLQAAMNDPDDDVRRAAAGALSAGGDAQSVEVFIRSLKDPSPEIRRVAVVQIGQSRDPRAVEPLIEVLQKDNNRMVRWTAAEALGQFSDPRVVPALIDGLHDGDEEVSKHAFASLASLKMPSCVDPLIADLSSPNTYHKRKAAELLGLVGDPRALEPLLGLLKDPDGNVRLKALVGLGHLKDERAVKALTPLLNDPDFTIRDVTRKVLKQITWTDVGADPRRWEKVEKRRSTGMLGRIGASRPERLIPIKIIAIVVLIKVLSSISRPLVCAGIYVAFRFVLVMGFSIPLKDMVTDSVIAFGLASLYFWLLDRYDGDAVIWWPVAIVGTLITVL